MLIGSIVHYCRLPDGRVENQWQLYRTEQLNND
ncbi:DUF333 domain-containing protein [Vreelandella sulfidaeris]|nr:DUF333 domain-containing protein [Halomonas sulfidaeris]